MNSPSRIPVAPDYPGYGNPCNGCGQCCQFGPCPVAMHFKTWVNGQCKALISKSGRYWCGMMTKPAKYSRMVHRSKNDAVAAKVRWMLGAGVKCDARKAEPAGVCQ